MTLPATTILPIHSQDIIEGGEALDKYMKELVNTLQRQYEDLSEAINGNIRSNEEQGSRKYTPTVISTGGTPGVGTYDNDGHQIGWVLRRGIVTDVWFDIQWSAHTGDTGEPMAVTLPYSSAVSSQKPFFGTLYASNITYAGDYLVCNATPGTRNCTVWEVTAGAPGAQVNLDTSGQLAGHIRYIGQGIER